MPAILKTILEERYLYLLAIAGLGVGLPLGKAIISISGIVLACAWIFDTLYRRDLAAKWRLFMANRAALGMTGIFVLHLLGMLYTSDMEYGMHDLRTKLPLLFMPLMISSMPPLESGQRRGVVLLHLLATLICMGVAVASWQTATEAVSLRESIAFISHIRLALVIVMGMVLAVTIVRPDTTSGWLIRLAAVIFGLWFMASAQMMTGLLVLGAVVAVGLLMGMKYTRYRWPLVIGSLLLATGGGAYVYSAYTDYFDTPTVAFSAQETHTALGERYFVPDIKEQVENGRFVWQHYAPKEMERAWTQRSEADLLADDLRLHGALTRYLTAKDLRKDASGVAALSAQDIAHVEAGRVRPPEMDKGPLADRLDVFFFEWSNYKNRIDPNGQSLRQRGEYWQTALRIWQEEPLLGVGTGDVKQAFADQYRRDGSRLEMEFRHRSHQQYLSIAVALGAVGLLLFVFFLYWPLLPYRGPFSSAVLLFFLVLSLSFLTEDTLESQAGMTVYVYYMAILLLTTKSTHLETPTA